MSKKQTSFSRSSTECEAISLDAGLRKDGIPALGEYASKHHQNSTRRRPRETQKERNGGGRVKKKKREILGGPAEGVPPFEAPPFGAPPFKVFFCAFFASCCSVFSEKESQKTETNLGKSRFGQSRSVSAPKKHHHSLKHHLPKHDSIF